MCIVIAIPGAPDSDSACFQTADLEIGLSEDPMADQEEQKKNKKINRMSLQEVTDALKKTEEHMKGDTSQYAQALIARKAELESK